MSQLTTLAAVKQWLALQDTTASDDLLTTLIDACSTYIENWLNRQILVATYTETRNGQGGPFIATLNFPIVSVASVIIDGLAIQARGPLGPTITGNGGPSYVFDDIQIMLCGAVFPRGVQNVSFVYSAGYTTVPADIDHACVEMIGDWFKYRTRIGTLSESIEGQSISFTDVPITRRAMGVLQQYKKVYQ
jgi:hypothetical protein